jgi:tellurium resistance protein TerD
VAIAVTIHDGEGHKQNFGTVQNAFVGVVNDLFGVQIARYGLTEDYSVETALTFGEG